MDKKDKELLLKDLCARLPYGVKVSAIGWDKPIDLMKLDINRLFSGSLDTPKPYLRPMSSMTKEEREMLWELLKTLGCKADVKRLDWLTKNKFDYRGLIEKGLAIEVTKDNNPYE